MSYNEVQKGSQNLLEETRTLLEPIATAADLHLAVEAPKEAIVVKGDHERLLQALGNLVGNAVKFSPKGGHVALRIEQATNGQEAHFCVAGRQGGRRGVGWLHVDRRSRRVSHGGGSELSVRNGRLEMRTGVPPGSE